jgi:two-component sensor histidine kinase
MSALGQEAAGSLAMELLRGSTTNSPTGASRYCLSPCSVRLTLRNVRSEPKADISLRRRCANELVLNAGKHAYPNSSGGSIWVRVVRTEKDIVQISVRDEGVGLPSGFDPPTSKRLGSRLINALAKQLGAELTRPVSAIGTNFMLLIPLGSATANQSLHAEM